MRDYAHFLSIARGSATELETLLMLAVRLGYADAMDTAPILQCVTEISKMLLVQRTRLLRDQA